jgi:tetratricopeptide (TPR) repeat protein
VTVSRQALDAAVAANAPEGQLGALAFEVALTEQLDGKDAAPTLQRALDWCSRAFGASSAEAFEVLLTLAGEHARRGRGEAAASCLDELISRCRPGTDDHVRALGMAGAFWASFKQWDQAERYLSRALDGAQGAQRVEVQHALGRTWLELGRLDEGRALLQEAARAGSGAAAVDLADALVAADQLPEALKILEQGAKGSDKRWSIECTSRLAALLRISGRPAEAEKHAREVVMAADELEPQQPAVLALFELAAVQAQLNKNTDALRVLQRALEAVEKQEPLDLYAWSQVQLRIGAHLLYGFAGREADALPFLERALGALQRVAGAASPECAEVLVHVAVATLRAGDLAAAKGISARAAALYERAYGPGNPVGKGAAELASQLGKL